VNVFYFFDNNPVNSPRFCQLSYQLISPKVNLSTQTYALLFLDKFPQNKNRDYPSGLEPDLKSRKVLIYSHFYILTSLPLTSILPSPHGSSWWHWYQILILQP